MFEGFAEYSKIVVMGPHRSGTTIGALCISDDTGHDLIIQEKFNNSNEIRIRDYMKSKGRLVLQAPGMICMDIFAGMNMSKVLSVCMVRPIEEIQDSSDRAFHKHGRKIGFRPDRSHVEDIYNKWDKYQREGHYPNVIVLPYMILATHRRWVSEKKRRALGKAWHYRRVEI